MAVSTRMRVEQERGFFWHIGALVLWLSGCAPSQGAMENTQATTSTTGNVDVATARSTPGESAGGDTPPDDGIGLLAGDAPGVQAAGMIEVPAGPFLMGSSAGDVGYFLDLCRQRTARAERERFCTEDVHRDEQPQRTIELDGFFIDRVEVSVAAYLDCIEAGACTAPSPPGESDCSIDATWALSGDLPVNCVTWHQPDTYCRWLGKRLPTAAEWEKAARGTEGARFPWGEHVPGCDEIGRSGTIHPSAAGESGPGPVDGYSGGASPYGVLRMADNVEEWTADWYHAVSKASEVNPAGPSSGEARMVKGGTFVGLVDAMRAASRGALEPDAVSDFTGFRCAVSASQVAPEDSSTH